MKQFPLAAPRFGRRSGHRRAFRRRRTHELTSAIEFCETRILLSANGSSDDHADTPGPDATPVTVPDGESPQVVFSGHLGIDDPADVFRIEITEPRLFETVATRHSGFEGTPLPAMRLESDRMGERAEPAGALTYALTAGVWYVVVEGPGNPNGDFEFDVRLTRLPEDDHVNTIGPDATLVEVQTSDGSVRVSGELSHINDRDTFRFDIDHPTVLHRTVADRDAVTVEVFDAAGRAVGNQHPEDPSSDRSFPVPAGTVWIQVSGNPGFLSGPYSVRLTMDDHPDTPALTGGAVLLGPQPGEPRHGTLERPGDRDVFRFEVAQDSDLAVTVTSGVAAAVLGPDGSRIAVDGDDMRLPAGTWYLELADAGSGAMAWAWTAQLQPILSPPVQLTSGIGPAIDPTPVFQWPSVHDAKSWEIYISPAGSLTPLFRQSGITTTTFELPTPLERGEYTVWVRAHRTGNRLSRWGEGQQLQIGGAPIVTPESNDGVVRWSPVGGADRYEVWVGTPESPQSAREQVFVASTNAMSWVIPSAVAAGNYVAFVRAIGPDDDARPLRSDWSPVITASLRAPFDTPDIQDWHVTRVDLSDGQRLVISAGPTPLHRSVPDAITLGVFQTGLMFRVIDADTGDVLISDRNAGYPQWNVEGGTSVAMSLSARDIASLSDRTVAVQARRVATQWPLEFEVVREGTSWVNRIRKDRPRSSDWSQPFRFTADADDLTVIGDTAGSGDTTPTLDWPAAPDRTVFAPVDHPDPPTGVRVHGVRPGLPFYPPDVRQETHAANYELWVTNATSRQRVVHEHNLPDSGYTFDSELDPGVYYAWIRATYDDGVYAGWSPVHQITVPAPPVRITNGGGSTVDATPVIEWDPVSAAGTYEIWVRSNDDGRPAYRVAGLRWHKHRIADPLPVGNYTVWVRAHLRNGSVSRWGQGTRLEIGSPPEVADDGSLIHWSAASAATHYEVWADEIDDTGASLRPRAIHEAHVTSTSFRLPPIAARYRVWVRAARSEAGDTYYSSWSRFRDVTVAPSEREPRSASLSALWAEDPESLFDSLAR